MKQKHAPWNKSKSWAVNCWETGPVKNNNAVCGRASGKTPRPLNTLKKSEVVYHLRPGGGGGTVAAFGTARCGTSALLPECRSAAARVFAPTPTSAGRLRRGSVFCPRRRAGKGALPD